jgi:transposase
MSTVLIGIDLAKNVFQVHGLDEQGKVTVRKRLNRGSLVDFIKSLPAGCVIAMEACGSAHHWGRVFQEMGYQVRLLPPHKVKAYVAPGKKNDANDAAAIAEAASRPQIQPVAVKSVEQQAVLALHSSRDLLVRQKTALVNALRSHLAEFGHVAAKGIEKLPALLAILATADLPDLLRLALRSLTEQMDQLDKGIDTLTKAISEHAKASARCRLLDEIPGIGALTASLLEATVPDMRCFPTARHFSAWLGLVPRQNSSGGKTRLGRIVKTGNVALRSHLVLGATSLLRLAASKAPPPWLAWASRLLKHKSYRLVSIALANKMARSIWALLTTGEVFDRKRWSGTGAELPQPQAAV